MILTIDSVQKSDTEKEYILEARNDEGAFEYRIALSTSTEPAGNNIETLLYTLFANHLITLILSTGVVCKTCHTFNLTLKSFYPRECRAR